MCFTPQKVLYSKFLVISSDILKSVDSAASTVMVILELISAFGTVDDSILINRLLGFALKWFKSYLSGRKFGVFANQVMPDSKSLFCGVPQGSVCLNNSLTLFLGIFSP